jgi:hypothetical protein
VYLSKLQILKYNFLVYECDSNRNLAVEKEGREKYIPLPSVILLGKCVNEES